MGDKRRHRGPHPEDAAGFSEAALPELRAAASDFVWLLSRGYAQRSGIKLVGDRYALTERQRLAVARVACSNDDLANRATREISLNAIAGRTLWIDGYNVLTTVEAALAGGLVLAGREGAWRDLASIHGHFKFVEETSPALEAIGQTLERLHPARCVWLLDRPVSNSGRLATRIRETAEQRKWPWDVELVQNPDPLLAAPEDSEIVSATADSVILDRCPHWIALTREVISTRVEHAWVLKLFP